MNNKCEVFKSKMFGEVRVLFIEAKPFFVGKDITEALGYLNSSKALKDHCKGVTKRYILSNGGKQETSLIPEGDVYRLIMRSKLPEAEKFESWVCDEVLPSIRKYGTYIATEKDDEWFKIYGEAKETRKDFTDVIKEFVEYAKANGSKSADRYYANFSKLFRSKLGVPKTFKKDELEQRVLREIQAFEVVSGRYIRTLMEKETPYKEVYQEIKKLIEMI